MLWKGFRDIQATIIIDLTNTEEALWESLDKEARWGMNKAEKEGRIVKESLEEESLKKFYEIYKETCRYGGINPQTLDQIKNRRPIFFFCYKDNKLIAGSAVIVESEEKFRLFLNASDKEYLKYQPNNILYWHMIKWGMNKYKYFDLGGYQLNAKQGDKLYHVNRFKERWGGKIKKYYVYSYNPIYILGRKLIRNSRTARWIWDRIKKRPEIRKN
jgi:lipid II:glycine glycyltransferase (peptidoglycan interpeptide bridge formation enzyme)